MLRSLLPIEKPHCLDGIAENMTKIQHLSNSQWKTKMVLCNCIINMTCISMSFEQLLMKYHLILTPFKHL